MTTAPSDTTPATLADLPYADLECAEYAAAPYEYLDRLCGQSWGARTSIGLIVLSYEAIQEIYNDQRFRTPGVATFHIQGVTSGLAYEWWENTLLNLEGAQHQRVRNLVRGPFSAKGVDRYRARMQQQVKSLADSLPAGEPFDFIEHFANPLPVGVVCSMLGVAEPDFDRFGVWTSEITLITQPVGWEENLPRVEKALAELFAYIDTMFEERRAEPRDDLMSDLIRAEAEGDRLTPGELKSLVALLLVGGMDTTRFQLGSMIDAYLDRPDLWEDLAVDPDSAPRVAEELLRHRPTIMENFRLATEDVEYRGLTIPAGTYISMSTVAANHDERFCPRGSEFDPTREPTRHVTFGKGPHFCLGAVLTRAELEETLRTLPACMTALTREGDVMRRHPRAITGPESVPMSFSRRP